MCTSHLQLKIINWSAVLIAAGLCTLGFAMRSHPMNFYELLLPGIIWTTLFYIVGYLCGEGLTFGQKTMAFFEGIENLLPEAIWSIKTGGWRIVVVVWLFVIALIPGLTKAYNSAESPLFESSVLNLYFVSLIWAGPTWFFGFIARQVEIEREALRKDEDITTILPDASLEEQMVWAVAHGDDRKVENLLKLGVPPYASQHDGRSLLMLIITKEGLDINKRLYVMRLLLERLSIREINAKDSAGWTPLMYAAARVDCDRIVIGELLLHDADPSIVNDEGESARDIAAGRNSPYILEIFDDQWAMPRVKEVLSIMNAQRARVRKFEQEQEQEKALPSILECHKRALSLSVGVGVILALLSPFFA